MTKVKIAVSLPREDVAEARHAVAEGRARSVSAFVSGAIGAQRESRGLRAYLAELIREYGAPTKEDYAWAEEQLRDMRGESVPPPSVLR